MEPPLLKGYDFDEKIVEEYIRDNKMLILTTAYNSKCNLKCPFCFTDRGRKSTYWLEKIGENPKHLEYNEIINLIDHGIEFGIKTVCFFGEGEPLIEDNVSLFFNLIAHINKKNLTPLVFTNGTTINNKLAVDLYKNNVSVVGKIYSLNPIINEELTGNENIYKYEEVKSETVPSYISSLMNAGYENTNRFALNTVVTSENYREIEYIWAWERKIGVIPYIDFLYTVDDQYDITDEQRKELCYKIWNIDNKLGFSYELNEGPHLGHRICNTNLVLTIGVNGDFRICPTTYVFLGNIREYSIRELLKKKSEKEKEICWKCEDKKKCGSQRLRERNILSKR